MTNLTPLRNFIQEPHCDLGDNTWRLADLVRTMRNKRFIDLGVRLGASSAIMSIESDERNNQVCGCDLDYDGFFKNGRRFVSENYTCYQADSVTLGKNWDEDQFDIIFVDTIFENGNYLLKPVNYPPLRYAEIIRVKFATNVELEDMLFNTKGMSNAMKQSERICFSNYVLDESAMQDNKV